MKKSQVSVLRRYIKENPNLSNNALSKEIVKNSNEFKGYSSGSVANYLGKVKKLNSKEIDTTKGNILTDLKEKIPNKEVKKEIVNFGHEVIILGVNTGLTSIHNILNNSMLHNIRTVVEFGDDVRIKELFLQPQKTSNYFAPESLSLGNLKESNALYDAIAVTINKLITNIDTPSDEMVNITIITDAPEYGSMYNTEDYINELISKVSRKFNWSINLIYLGDNQKGLQLCKNLNIDSSNFLSCNVQDVSNFINTAVINKNKLIKSGDKNLGYNFF